MKLNSLSKSQQNDISNLIKGLIKKRDKTLNPVTVGRLALCIKHALDCGYLWINQKHYIQKEIIKNDDIYKNILELRQKIKGLTSKASLSLEISAFLEDNFVLSLEEISSHLSVYQRLLKEQKDKDSLPILKTGSKPVAKTIFSVGISTKLIKIYTIITKRLPGQGRGDESWEGRCATFLYSFYDILQPNENDKEFITTKPTKANILKQIQRYGQTFKK